MHALPNHRLPPRLTLSGFALSPVITHRHLPGIGVCPSSPPCLTGVPGWLLEMRILLPRLVAVPKALSPPFPRHLASCPKAFLLPAPTPCLDPLHKPTPYQLICPEHPHFCSKSPPAPNRLCTLRQPPFLHRNKLALQHCNPSVRNQAPPTGRLAACLLLLTNPLLHQAGILRALMAL
jgi:hypothetical protein